MYDLVATGRREEVVGALNDEISRMPLEKQLEIQGDPEKYGQAFFIVVQRLNDSKNSPQTEPEGSDESDDSAGLDVVSSGNKNRESKTAQSDGPDWKNMSSEEFQKRRSQMGLNF